MIIWLFSIIITIIIYLLIRNKNQYKDEIIIINTCIFILSAIFMFFINIIVCVSAIKEEKIISEKNLSYNTIYDTNIYMDNKKTIYITTEDGKSYSFNNIKINYNENENKLVTIQTEYKNPIINKLFYNFRDKYKEIYTSKNIKIIQGDDY